MSRSLFPWLVTGFMVAAFSPLINASNQAIWQTKVAPDVQGRVFATRRLIAWSVAPIAQLVAGPLADLVLEPAFASTHMTDTTLGVLFGSGPGAGMGLQMALGGLCVAGAGLAGYLFPTIRDVETQLPDFDAELGPASPLAPGSA